MAKTTGNRTSTFLIQCPGLARRIMAVVFVILVPQQFLKRSCQSLFIDS
jgi:hypothetical protein